MRHCIYYNYAVSGRNDGSPLYYWNVLKNKLKLDVTHLFPQGDTEQGFGKFDYHWWVDWGEDALAQMGLVDLSWKIPKDGGKTIYVASDTHLDDGYRLRKAREFDYVFFNQKRACQEYHTQYLCKMLPLKEKDYELCKDLNTGQYIGWLPHAFEPQAYHPIEIIKKYDVCFVGHMQDVKNHLGFSRTDALDRLFKEFPNFYYGSRSPVDPSWNLFEDAAMKFSLSKIAFNVSIGEDLNMRFWEILGTSSFQLTNVVPDLKDVEKDYGLIDGKHFVTYSSLDEMIVKAKYYLEHDEEREIIAKAGYEQAIKVGTYENRVNRILGIVK